MDKLPQTQSRKKVCCFTKLVFTNTIMALAMKTREKAKDIRQAQQQDLRERK
jgi:hypothetical protein